MENLEVGQEASGSPSMPTFDTAEPYGRQPELGDSKRLLLTFHQPERRAPRNDLTQADAREEQPKAGVLRLEVLDRMAVLILQRGKDLHPDVIHEATRRIREGQQHRRADGRHVEAQEAPDHRRWDRPNAVEPKS